MYSEILILALLRERPRHGYDIKKDVEQALAGTVALNNKTLYTTLKRFEESGAVTRQVVVQEGKPSRHLYQLTERGIELLGVYLRDFGPEQAGNEAEFFTRVAFFDYLEPEERVEILKQRLAHLASGLEYLNTMQYMSEQEECAPIMGVPMYAQRVLAFHHKRIQDEYQWLASWLDEMQATLKVSRDAAVLRDAMTKGGTYDRTTSSIVATRAKRSSSASTGGSDR